MHLSLDLEHILQPVHEFDHETFLAKLQNLEAPAFQQHQPDVAALIAQLAPFKNITNLIIIANGGSRTSALAYHQSLAHLRNDLNVELLSTMEPDVISTLLAGYSPDTTVVMPISKSGTNIDVIEPLLQFMDFPIVAVTSPQKGVLYEMAQVYDWPIIPHPEVGGRYSGRTECGLAPAYLMGLDIATLNSAAVAAYEQFDYSSSWDANIALQAAVATWLNDKAGYSEIFMPVYSQALAGFLPLWVQLIHESTGKDGLGQTIFGDQAPESQHHTNQRFFGGRKNVMGWFITVERARTQLATTVPERIAQLDLRGEPLHKMNGIPLQQAVKYDYEGVAESATQSKIPHMTLQVEHVNEQSVGELLSFMHFYTVYSALLRDQDPFDQPEVEAAKNTSFSKRLHHGAI